MYINDPLGYRLVYILVFSDAQMHADFSNLTVAGSSRDQIKLKANIALEMCVNMHIPIEPEHNKIISIVLRNKTKVLLYVLPITLS